MLSAWMMAIGGSSSPDTGDCGLVSSGRIGFDSTTGFVIGVGVCVGVDDFGVDSDCLRAALSHSGTGPGVDAGAAGAGAGAGVGVA